MIKPEELEELNNESGIVIANADTGENDTTEKTGKMRYRTEQRCRDLVMSWKGEAELAVLALENQGKIHYAMPVRGMVLLNFMNYSE